MSAKYLKKQQSALDILAKLVDKLIADTLYIFDYDDQSQLAVYASVANPKQVEAQTLSFWIIQTWEQWESLTEEEAKALDPVAWINNLPEPVL